MSAHNADKKGRLYAGAAKVKKGYIGDKRFYSAGNIVTYHVDTNVSYQEEVDDGQDVLHPTSFTPSKSGWTFLGWRIDRAASSSVLSSKVMGDDSIDLYAVFRQTVRLSYAGNGNTGGSTAYQDNYRFYNNGNVTNATFTLRANGFTKSYHTFSGWSVPGQGTLAAGKTVTISANTTATAVWTAVATYLVSGGTFNVNYTRGSFPSKDDGNSMKYRANLYTSNATSLAQLPEGMKPILAVTGGGNDNYEVVAYIEWDIPAGFRYYRVDACVSAACPAGRYLTAHYRMDIINANTGAVVAKSSDLGWHGYKLEAVCQFDGGRTYVPGSQKYTSDIVDLGTPATYPVKLRINLKAGKSGGAINAYGAESDVIFPTVRIYN